MLRLAFIGLEIPRKHFFYIRTYLRLVRITRRVTNCKQFATTFAQVTRHKWRSDDGARDGRNFGPGHLFSQAHDVHMRAGNDVEISEGLGRAFNPRVMANVETNSPDFGKSVLGKRGQEHANTRGALP